MPTTSTKNYKKSQLTEFASSVASRQAELLASQQQQTDCGIQEEEQPSSPRRHFLQHVAATTAALASLSLVSNPMYSNAFAVAAEPPANPLNLKGTFWETGALYDKSKQTPLSFEPEDIIQYLQLQAQTLKSFDNLVVDGEFTRLSKLLRGGVMSETQLRKQSFALVDQMPDEDENPNTYLANDALRIFLNSWDNLDRIVDGASKSNVGGVANTIGMALVSPYNAANQVARISSATSGAGGAGGAGGNDPRILVLDALNDTTKQLEKFVTISKKALSM